MRDKRESKTKVVYDSRKKESRTHFRQKSQCKAGKGKRGTSGPLAKAEKKGDKTGHIWFLKKPCPIDR